jgi:hypothetical protein
MPHLAVETVEQTVFDYASVWQQKNLVLVVIGDLSADAAAYLGRLDDARRQFDVREAVAIVTRTPIDGLSVPGLLVVDRWGRVIHAAHVSQVSELPSVEDLLAWLDYVQMRCG